MLPAGGCIVYRLWSWDLVSRTMSLAAHQLFSLLRCKQRRLFLKAGERVDQKLIRAKKNEITYKLCHPPTELHVVRRQS
jgi:hypothetical protein